MRCHTYFDKEGDIKKGADIIFNSKNRRPSVCNTLDSLVIHADRLSDLPELCIRMASKNVVIEADEQSYAALDGKYPAELLEHATDESFGKEFLAYRMSIKTVPSYEEALLHIRRYTSHHSECIVTENVEHGRKFQQYIDAACVYVNVSTAFTITGPTSFSADWSGGSVDTTIGYDDTVTFDDAGLGSFFQHHQK